MDSISPTPIAQDNMTCEVGRPCDLPKTISGDSKASLSWPLLNQFSFGRAQTAAASNGISTTFGRADQTMDALRRVASPEVPRRVSRLVPVEIGQRGARYIGRRGWQVLDCSRYCLPVSRLFTPSFAWRHSSIGCCLGPLVNGQ